LSIEVPFLRPVVPPHVFCLLPEGVTYARVRAGDPAGFEEVRHFRYPAGSTTAGAEGATLPTRESLAEAVKAARALAGGRLARASVIFPDTWARVLAVEVDAIPDADDAGREMVLWKLRKILPGHPTDLAIAYAPMPELADEKRVLVAATPRTTVEALESAFEACGVRVGYLAPASLALFEGLAATLSRAASGDYALLHRTGSTLTFFIARGTTPIFYRQRPPESDDGNDHEREARLSLSYYAEKLKGPGLAAVYVHDELPDRSLESLGAFPVAAIPVAGRLFSADRAFDERVAARPELLAGFAAVWGAR
jgi:Tfp pilus assembly PilM family ATPase